jgi:hypothetical protein
MESRQTVNGSRTYIVARKTAQVLDGGLRGMVLVSEHGEAWQVLANLLDECPMGQRLNVPLGPMGEPDWDAFGFQVPQKLPDAPKQTVEKILATADPSVPDYYDPAKDDDPPAWRKVTKPDAKQT